MIVQYIFLVSDIKNIKKGSLIAQACHGSIKAIQMYKDLQDTKDYLNLVDSMTSIILKIKSQDVKDILQNFGSLDLVQWIEQPENVVTCLALRPYKKRDLLFYMPLIQKYKLF